MNQIYQSEELQDSIDDIILLLQGQNTIHVKNVQKRESETDDRSDVLDDLRNVATSFKQPMQLNTSGKQTNLTIVRKIGAPPNIQRPSARQVGSSAPRAQISSPVFETIRYLAFKPYSGIQVEPGSLKQTGYSYRSNGGCVKLIKGTLEENGFTETSGKNWTVLWNSGTIRTEVYVGLFAYQKVCHFPKSYEMTRKDLMHRNISKMQITHGLSNFGFIPKTYILPAEMSYFLEEHDKIKTQNPMYICKPHASSQGKGIFLTDKIQEILNRQSSNNSYVISHYIQNPMLVNGLKFDLRIYIAITSINPLRIYFYEDGLARFATEEFTMDIDNKFVHLTNYAVQKESPTFVANSDSMQDNIGTKWSLISLMEYLKHNGVNVALLMDKIDDIVIKTIMSVESQIFQACEMHVPFRSNCFSLLGFDILIDQNSRPWLLEVNLSPSLNIDAPIDLKIKGEMIADMFTLVGVVPLDQRFSNDHSFIKNSNAFANDKKNTFSFNQQNPSQLSAFEKYIIRESEEENRRSRRWRRIFPNEITGRYKSFFEQDRLLNIILRNHELDKNKALNNTNNHPLNASSNQKKLQQQPSALANAGRQRVLM